VNCVRRWNSTSVPASLRHAFRRSIVSKQNLEEPVNDRFGCLFTAGLDSR
jgi:hypothetical protein